MERSQILPCYGRRMRMWKEEEEVVVGGLWCDVGAGMGLWELMNLPLVLLGFLLALPWTPCHSLPQKK